MNIAVISLTERGRQLSHRIAETCSGMTVRRWCFYKHTDAEAEAFASLPELTAALFPACDALLFVCACGIAVRAIAPHLRSKATDPAVLVMDDGGSFVIPILSGHLGGANALAQSVADKINAQSVVTTATDVGGKFSPDSFAAANHLLLTDLTAAKEIAAAVLDGEPVGLVSEYPAVHLPPEIQPGAGCRVGLSIGRRPEMPFPVTLPLVPQNIVLGIGCKRGTSAETLRDAVTSVLETAGIPIGRICCAATVDLKAHEPGLTAFCGELCIPLVSYSAQELMETPGNFTASAFVRQVTGADNVCERSAVRCSGGELLLRKTAVSGVTVALAETPVTLDFERRML